MMPDFRYAQPGNVPVVRRDDYRTLDGAYYAINLIDDATHSWPDGAYGRHVIRPFSIDGTSSYAGATYLTVEPEPAKLNLEAAAEMLREAGYTVTAPPEDMSEAIEFLAGMFEADGGIDAHSEGLRARSQPALAQWKCEVHFIHNRLKEI